MTLQALKTAQDTVCVSGAKLRAARAIAAKLRLASTTRLEKFNKKEKRGSDKEGTRTLPQWRRTFPLEHKWGQTDTCSADKKETKRCMRVQRRALTLRCLIHVEVDSNVTHRSLQKHRHRFR